METLDWGHRYLMCPPDHFEVAYAINPWMRPELGHDPDRARAEWDGLVATLRSAGATVELMDPEPGLPDMVFTANAGVVAGNRFVPAHFANDERKPETAHDAAWFAARGWEVLRLPADVVQEGAGDALPFGAGPAARLVAGHGQRSDRRGPQELGASTGFEVLPVELVNRRMYHLDLAFCPLDQRRALVAPDALSGESLRRLEEVVSEPLYLEHDETLQFCANSVVVGTNVVMPAVPPRVGRRLEAWGFQVAEAPVGEFQKAGGACRCLTLALDVPAPERRDRIAA